MNSRSCAATNATIASKLSWRDVDPAEALGDRDHADRQRLPGADGGGHASLPARPAAAKIEPRQFRRAAADVEHQRAVALGLDEIGAAGDGELGLGPAIDDLELEPDLFLDARDERRAVAGRAAGFGGDQPHAGRLVLAELVAALPQRLDCAVHGGIAEPAGDRQPFAEPHDAGKAVEHAKTVLVRTRDQQAAIVGTEIERRIERPARTARMRLVVLGPRFRVAPPGHLPLRCDLPRPLGRRSRLHAFRRGCGSGPILVGHSQFPLRGRLPAFTGGAQAQLLF